MTPMEPLDDFESRIVANVERHGCHVNFVFDPDDETPDFAYSVGFPATIDQPDVIIFGLPQEVMHFAVNQTLRLCKEGLKLAEWAEIRGLLDGHSVIARSVHQSRIEPEYFNSAMWFYYHCFGHRMDRAFQLVWPGAVDGLLPWDTGCAAQVIELQPALYEPRLNS
jgi:Domain of unknown function (DUF4262)